LLSKNQSAYVKSLHQKKFRDQHNAFIAEGIKLVTELLRSDIKVKQVFSSRNFQLSIFNYHIDVIRVTERELKRISALNTPNEVLAVCEIPSYKLDMASLASKLTIILDDIRDPGNLGTIMRVADWFGIDNIICSRETVDLFNPKVVQSTMGSIARVQLHYENLEEFFSRLDSNVPVYGAVMDGESIYSANLTPNGIIVIGNEGHGISENILSKITHKLTIPPTAHRTPVGGEAESLNAALATGILLSEFRRR
jgi:RNA methyltransferase, TrmH family